MDLFPQINLDGCREITERSLLSLGCHGNGLTVSARGTGVMFSPVSLMKSNSYFHLDGCPLVDAVSFTDDTGVMLVIMKLYDTWNIVIIIITDIYMQCLNPLKIKYSWVLYIKLHK